MSTYAVLGAGGGTGKACVDTLLQQGCHVRAVVRDPEKAKLTLLPNPTLDDLSVRERLEVVKGDVTDLDSLRRVLGGCSGVIFAASGGKEVDCQGVGNVADVARELGGVQRVVLVSSGLVTPARRWNPIRIMLNNLPGRRGLMDFKFQGEELLRKSGMPYTVVRPGRLADGPAGLAQLVAEQGDKSTGQVARADVAAVCVAALTDPAAENLTLELMGNPQPVGGGVPLAEQLKGIFHGLKKDA